MGIMVSLPLPKNHWLKQPGDNVPPMKWRTPKGIVKEILRDWITEAARYALRAASMNGQCWSSMDPDAIIQNLVVGMTGYWTKNGLSEDRVFNPVDVPIVPEWIHKMMRERR